MGWKNNSKALHFIYQNKWSAFSLFYILIWAFLALFAYVVAPDNTHNANWGDLNIASQHPGFELKMLEMPNQSSTSLKEYFFGSEHIPEKYPIRGFKIQQDSLMVQLYHPFLYGRSVLRKASPEAVLCASLRHPCRRSQH
jgi:peptide/nickel transport system permease protein